MTETLSPKVARRIALAAQGFGRARPETPGARHFRDQARKLGVIQIDSVNVVTRTHYLPTFSRAGAYPREALEAEAWGPRRSLFEYWGHEASLLPLDSQPLFRWRMERARDGAMWTGLARFGRERRDYIDGVLDEIERREEYKRFDVPTGDYGISWRYTRDPAPMRLTLVNGMPTFMDGRFTGAMAGEFISPVAEVELAQAAE